MLAIDRFNSLQHYECIVNLCETCKHVRKSVKQIQLDPSSFYDKLTNNTRESLGTTTTYIAIHIVVTEISSEDEKINEQLSDCMINP